MLTRIAAAAGLMGLMCVASVALADGDPGAVAVNAAHVTASKLRHQWDLARARDARAAACLEPKVSEAMVLIARIDHRRVEMRDAADTTTRDAARRSLAVLDARRADLEVEAGACGAPTAAPIVGGTTVTMYVARDLPDVDLLRALVGPMPMK